MKTVGATVVGHGFDCLPGHVQIEGRGSGATLRPAVSDAVRNMLNAPQLAHKRIKTFKMSVVIFTE